MSNWSLANEFISPFGSNTLIVSKIISDKYFDQIRKRLWKVLMKSEEELLAKQVGQSIAPRVSSWRPEVGLISTALATNQISLAVLQLAAISKNTYGTISARVEDVEYLLTDGWVTPIQGVVQVVADENKLTIESREGCADFRLEGTLLVPRVDNSRRIWQVTKTENHLPRYIIESGIPGFPELFPWPTKTIFESLRHRNTIEDSAIISKSKQMLHKVIACISKQSPTYAEWIKGIIDGIFLTTSSVNGSISSPDFPGLIALSRFGCELDYVEAIISEACHQYLFQLLLMSPLTEADSEELHYIPTRRTYVTTRRILVAAHKYINTILLLKQLAIIPEFTAQAHYRIAKRLFMLQTDCLYALEASKKLTSVGRDLWLRIEELANEIY